MPLRAALKFYFCCRGATLVSIACGPSNLINKLELLGFTRKPAVLPNTIGQEQLINILGGRINGQGIWGQPTPAKTATFLPGEGNPIGD